MFILAKYVYPYIQKPIQARQAIIAKQIEDAAAATKRFSEAETNTSGALTEARIEAARIRESARAEAQLIVEEPPPGRAGRVRSDRARGEEQLANQRGAIVRELRGEIGSLAVELSEKISTSGWPTTPRSRRPSIRSSPTRRRDAAGASYGAGSGS